MASKLAQERKQRVLRILLVGGSDHGKISTCNALIGEDVAEVSSASRCTTLIGQLYKVTGRFDRNLEIVDTPGIFDTKNDVKKMHTGLIRSIVLTTRGFHALAFVLRKDKVTDEIQEMKDIIFNWFGEDVKNHSFVILTDTSTEEEQLAFLRDKSHPSITELVRDCAGRVVPLQNKWKSNSLGRVKNIITMVEYIVAKNGNSSYSNVAYKLSKSLAEDKELLSNSIRPLIIEEISRKSLTRNTQTYQ